MSDASTALLISGAVACLLFVIATIIRVRGPVGMVKNVDWDRVSNPQGLGQFVSLILSIMAALIAGHGISIYAFHDDRATRNVCSAAFVILIAACTLVLIVGQLRYQDLPRNAGRGRDNGR